MTQNIKLKSINNFLGAKFKYAFNRPHDNDGVFPQK